MSDPPPSDDEGTHSGPPFGGPGANASDAATEPGAGAGAGDNQGNPQAGHNAAGGWPAAPGAEFFPQMLTNILSNAYGPPPPEVAQALGAIQPDMAAQIIQQAALLADQMLPGACWVHPMVTER